MAASIPSLSSSQVSEIMEEPTESCFDNPEIKRVALAIFKALGCIGFTMVMGATSFAVLGSGMWAIGLGVGAAIGTFAYLTVLGVHHVIEKYGFPSHRYRVSPPLSNEILTSEKKRTKFHTMFELKVKTLACYEEWKVHHEFETDKKAEKRLLKECQKGTCQGQTQTLISLLKDHTDLKDGQILNKVKSMDVCYRQILEYIRVDIGSDLVFDIPGAAPDLHKSFSKEELEQDKMLLATELKEALVPNNAREAVAMTIRLQNDTHDSHTIFAQVHPTFRIYDNSSEIYAGLHEGFKPGNQEHFFKTLQKHILSYHSATRPGALRFDDVIIRAYRIDRPEPPAPAPENVVA
jgi:hypothetical protein